MAVTQHYGQQLPSNLEEEEVQKSFPGCETIGNSEREQDKAVFVTLSVRSQQFIGAEERYEYKVLTECTARRFHHRNEENELREKTPCGGMGQQS